MQQEEIKTKLETVAKKQEIIADKQEQQVVKQEVQNTAVDNELIRQNDIDKLIYEKVFTLLERVIAMEVIQKGMTETNAQTVKDFRKWAITTIVLIVINILLQFFL